MQFLLKINKIFKNGCKNIYKWFYDLRYHYSFYVLTLCGLYYSFALKHTEAYHYIRGLLGIESLKFPFICVLFFFFIQSLLFLIIFEFVYLIEKFFKLKIKPNKFVENIFVLIVSYSYFLVIFITFLLIFIILVLPCLIFKICVITYYLFFI